MRDLFEILDATVGSVERVKGAPVSYNVVCKLQYVSKRIEVQRRVAVPVAGDLL